MLKWMLYFAVAVLVSLFYFSFSFTFLPESLNTKIFLTGIGLLCFVYHMLMHRHLQINRKFLGLILIVLGFSLCCYIAVDYNYTSDYSYATYFISFAVWLFAAYAVCSAIFLVHRQLNMRLLVFYLAAVCTAQCFLALYIDANEGFRALVNTYIYQEQDFLLRVQRLYGIGASLDNAGVRFSIVLIMIAALVMEDPTVRASTLQISVLLMAFFVIFIIGNMISRTTSLGGMLGFGYMLFRSGIFQVIIKAKSVKFNLIFTLLLALAILISMYFYYTDAVFHNQIRFAFEGFFNWVERGVWRTDSTDKLNNTMWIWPTTLKTWIIGNGLFDNWVYGTDIGYCRFILYCGLVGFTVFAFFFIYNAWIAARLFPRYRRMFLLFCCLTFLVWIKVSTDIFIIYALLFATVIHRQQFGLTVKNNGI